MANRTFNGKQALEKQIKSLYLDIAITVGGAALDVAKTANTSYGFKTAIMTRKGAGNYRLYLEDEYYFLKNINLFLVDGTERDYTFQVEAFDLNAASPYIDFFSLTGGVATDLADGTRLLGSIDLKNTTVI